MKTNTHEVSGTPKQLLLRPNEAADLLALSTRMLDYLRADGQITPLKIGRAVRYPLSEIERFIAARRQASRGRPRNTADSHITTATPTPGDQL